MFSSFSVYPSIYINKYTLPTVNKELYSLSPQSISYIAVQDTVFHYRLQFLWNGV